MDFNQPLSPLLQLVASLEAKINQEQELQAILESELKQFSTQLSTEPSVSTLPLENHFHLSNKYMGGQSRAPSIQSSHKGFYQLQLATLDNQIGNCINTVARLRHLQAALKCQIGINESKVVENCSKSHKNSKKTFKYEKQMNSRKINDRNLFQKSRKTNQQVLQELSDENKSPFQSLAEKDQQRSTDKEDQRRRNKDNSCPNQKHCELPNRMYCPKRYKSDLVSSKMLKSQSSINLDNIERGLKQNPIKISQDQVKIYHNGSNQPFRYPSNLGTFASKDIATEFYCAKCGVTFKPLAYFQHHCQIISIQQ